MAGAHHSITEEAPAMSETTEPVVRVEPADKHHHMARLTFQRELSGEEVSIHLTQADAFRLRHDLYEFAEADNLRKEIARLEKALAKKLAG